IRKSRKILHQGSQRELASGFMAFQHQRLQFGARRVERRGVTGTSRADDDNVANILHKKVSSFRLPKSDLDASPSRAYFLAAGFFAGDDSGFALASTAPSRANSSGTVVRAPRSP